ncbi:MAG: iscS [Oscillospiraceae bacterium]|jgi:cysteine desulfurase|nr:iscS [Oscillospiraceae bacterium]
MERFVYADNAATTKVSDRVLAAMTPFLQQNYGNPSSIYSIGRESKKTIEEAREKVSVALGASPAEIYFTSGGSEADNWAIKGAAATQAKKGKKHIITTNFEHHAVLHTCEKLARDGFEITYLPINDEGYITAEQVREAIRPDTALVTIMYANNEIGTIQPIKEIGKVCREAKVWFHTDAVQAVGHVEINVQDQNIDMLSLSGHKIHAPKGVGALYIKKGIVLQNLIDGGGQERGKRAGTENIASIVGLGQAISDCTQDIETKIKHVSAMRDRLIENALKIPQVRLNGGLQNRLCGNANLSFTAVEGEALLLLLDMNGICGSSGSACTSGSLDPSHVLLALGLPHETAHGSLRLSINEETSDEDIDYIIKTLPPVIERLRAMSPLWDK